MKKILLALVLCSFTAAFVALAEEAPETKEKSEKGGCPCQKGKAEKVAVADIPAVVKDAAEKKVEGITITGAMAKKKGGKTVYKVMGKLGDKEYCVMVDSDGTVIDSKEKGGCKGGEKKCGAEKK